jgi:adenylate kinase
LNNAGALTQSLLIITGSMGAGKTTVLPEASDILALRHIARAAKLNTILDGARPRGFHGHE